MLFGENRGKREKETEEGRGGGERDDPAVTDKTTKLHLTQRGEGVRRRGAHSGIVLGRRNWGTVT